MKNIKDLIKTLVNIQPCISGIFKDHVEIFVESKIKDSKKREKYLKELEKISLEEDEWKEEMLRFLFKVKAFLSSGMNKKQKWEMKPAISAWTHIHAWWDIIVWNNNKNIFSNLSKSWQDNVLIYIIVGVIITVISTLILWK